MGKQNQALRGRTIRTGVQGPIVSEPIATGRTHQGGEGFAHDPKSELFLLAVTHFVGQDTFYETGNDRNDRFRDLVRACAKADPAWTADLIVWLRTKANMRSAPIVAAVEFALTQPGLDVDPRGAHLSSRRLVDAVCRRADEPGEILAYHLATYGRRLPKALKRGLGDAAVRLYNEFSVGKWDSARNAIRFADVIELSNVDGHRGVPKRALFKYLLDARHGRGVLGDDLPMLSAADSLRRQATAQPGVLLDTASLRAAGFTWNDALSLAGNRVDKAKLWQALIPTMGYTALLRNLRNFDDAGIDKATRATVAQILADPHKVAGSGVLPMQYLTAYYNIRNDFWKPVLDEAATHSLANVPKLAGNTLILVDTSSSMHAPFTTRPPGARVSDDITPVMRWDAAAMFGIAAAHACDKATVVSFSSPTGGSWWGRRNFGVDAPLGYLAFSLKTGENLLASVARFRSTAFIGNGTDTAAAVRANYTNHDRVIVLTDEQAAYDHERGGVFGSVPATTPVYTFNLAGYKMGHAASGPYRHVVGGLTDAAFTMIAALENHRAGRWPWQV